jgi:hypothetical protein
MESGVQEGGTGGREDEFKGNPKSTLLCGKAVADFTA